MLGLETVLFSLFLPSKNHNLHACITCRMMRCNTSMSLRFGSGWLLIYFWICSCTFIQNISMFVLRRARRRGSVGITFDCDHELREVREWISNPDDRRPR